MLGQALNTHTQVSQLDDMSWQCSSVPIVNVSGPLRWGFSRTHCVNTSSCLCEWLDDLATCHLFDLVGPTRSSSGQNKQDPVPAWEGEVIPHSLAHMWLSLFHLFSDTGEKMSVCFDRMLRWHYGKTEQLDVIRGHDVIFHRCRDRKSFHFWKSEKRTLYYASESFGAPQWSTVHSSHLLAAVGSQSIKTLHEHTEETILQSQVL